MSKKKQNSVTKRRLFKSGNTIRLRWDFCRSRISAGFQPEPEPKSDTALTVSWLLLLW